MDKRKPIIALDFASKQATLDWLDQFPDQSLNVKVGMTLYYSVGPDLLTTIKDRGHDIFLDLKLHDIPNTVGGAMTQLAKLGVDMVNVHAAGGRQMMTAAKEGLDRGTPAGKQSPLLIAVTQLTSTSQETMQADQLITCTLEESVSHYAQISHLAGLDGVVCSPREAKLIKAATGPDFITVCPGIRPANYTNRDDQVRIMTPEKAAQNGCDYIVVGRPITQAPDPYQSYLNICQAWQEALND
ncbi:orotidine 5'-phosphate decarboxylase [Aerococcus urinaehominis]|uniref:Orotidine 5'-phosphate decarboxylase n=1 Tax=Aerococcus urinaehominis TaxID=128944 RepID=A0A109RGE3_9LACT|nr:orotidine-5'-phosphate decarboxylase [Aerococcus urinaehominis]AMB99085.1 orotidine 5'-phosphate decarboxylase [Aerococcus urinaehominis]SDM03126.1 orotidine-5'-phosphate decarboxylase [Aerococcus urinaehominis]